MFPFIKGKMDLIYYLYYFYWVTITISNHDKFQCISIHHYQHINFTQS